MKRSVRPVQSRSAKTIDTIVAAAETIIAREGLRSFTIDAVAAAAGLSKGAVLHHFRSKEALIGAMVSRQLALIRAGRRSERAGLSGHRNRVLLATIRQSARRWVDPTGFPPALMVAAIENAHCLDEIRAFGDDTFRRIRAGSSSPDDGTVLGYAALGLLLARALGFATVDRDAGLRLFEAMERMADALD